MRLRTRLILLATSTIVVAGTSLGRPADAHASTCTDYCYSQFRWCMWDPEPGESVYCYEDLDWCLSRCPA